MKTAMEMALARIEMLYIEKDSIHWEMFKNDCMEKEKEQIIDAWEKGYSTGCVVGSNDYTNEDEEKDNGNYYYNQTYNQNKEQTNKVCENKLDGVCPLHNLFCKYPDCENQ
jgi:hypothetical protein